MANLRFHEKYHGTLHHTLSSPGVPGSGTDPLASKYRPFIGDFHLNGSLSASGNGALLGDLSLGTMESAGSKARLHLTTSTTPAGGIRFGDDTYPMHMYRNAANEFYIDPGVAAGWVKVPAQLKVNQYALFDKKMSIGTTDVDGQLVVNSNDADLFHAKASNQTKFIVKDTGRVGIGLDSPDTALHIKTTASEDEVTLENEHGNKGLLNIDSAGNFEIRSGVGEELQFFTNGASRRLTISSSGLVAIGSHTPTQALHVNSGNNAAVGLFESSGSSSWIQVRTSAGPSWQMGATSSGLSFYSDETQRYNVYFAQSGNVGIDTSSPSEKLHVKSGNTLIENDDGTYLRLKTDTSSLGRILFHDTQDSGEIYYNHSTNTMGLATGTTNAVDRIQILSDGKVVIKDPGQAATGAAPIIGTYLLDVQGPLVQSTNAASTFYSLAMRRSGSSLTNVDIYDINGHGLVLGKNSSSPTLTISQSTSGAPVGYVDGVGINMAPEEGSALSVSGHVKIHGDLTVTGPFTTVTGEVTIQDPVIQLGTETETGAAADTYDRGAMIVYDNDGNSSTPSLSGFFGMERETQKFVFYRDATWDATGNNATGTLGPAKFSSLESTSNMQAAGDLRVDGKAIFGSIQETPTADITTLYTSYIRPLVSDKVFTRSRYISLMGSSGDYPTVSIGRDASLVNNSYQLYVHGGVFLNGGTSVRKLYFTSYTGSFDHSKNSRLFCVVNGGNDNQLRHANKYEMRDALNLTDAAITTIAAIRAPLLKTAGGTVTGNLAVTAPGTYSGTSPATVSSTATHSGGQAFAAYVNDRGRVLISRNRSASNDEQVEIHHDYNQVSIINKRGNLQLAGGTSDTRLSASDSNAWHLRLHQDEKIGCMWIKGSTKHQIWHSGNLDPQAYGVHTLQPNYVKHGGNVVASGFIGNMTGTVTIDQNWLNHCVKHSKNASPTYRAGTVWSTENHGPGSGLNADKLDNLQASSFCRIDSRSTFRQGFRWTTGGSGANTGSTTYPFDHYGMYREGYHSGDNPYRSVKDGFSGASAGHAKLAINWHRGINIRAYPGFGGVQFYGNTYHHSMLHNLIFSVGRGDHRARTHGENAEGGTLHHRTDAGTEYKYLHEGNMAQLSNATTFDGQDSDKFMKEYGHTNDGTGYDSPNHRESDFRYKRNGFWGTGHRGHSGAMLSWGTDSGSTSRVQLWSRYTNTQHFIRTGIDNNRWSNWTRIHTDNNTTHLSQFTNNRNYVRATWSSEYHINQNVNTNNNVTFNGVKSHWLMLHSNSGYGIEVANDLGNQYMRFDSRGLRCRQEFYDFRNRSSQSLLYLDNNNSPGNRDNGRAILYGGLVFRSGSNSSGHSTDEYSIHKYRHGYDSSELRLVLGDNRGSEAFSIWDGHYSGSPQSRSHYFRNDGYTWLGGHLHCESSIRADSHIYAENEGGYAQTYLKQWGLYTPGGTMYLEPKAGHTLHIVPTNWSQNLHTNIYGRVRIGGPSWGYQDRGLTVYGNIHTQSNVRAGGDIIAYYSDRRLKKNLKQLNKSSEIIKKLTGYRFEWNNKAEDLVPKDLYRNSQVGLIAQDVEDVLPEAVAGNGPRDLDYKTIKYDKLVPVLVEALKEEMSKREELEIRLDRLEKLISNK